MILDQPTRTLEIILGEAMATSNCDIVACYATSALASGTSGGTFTTAVAQAASNGTTAVTVVPAPAGGAQTQVNEVRVHNNDTISHRIMLRLNDGGTVRIVLAKTVSAGSDFLYSPTTQSDAGGGIQADGTTITNTAGVISVTYGTTANTAAEGNDARITGALSASGAATTYAPLVSPLLSATTQTAPAVVNANVTAPAAATSTAVVQVIGKDATGVKVEVDGYGGTPGFAGRRADGTQAAPTAVAANDTLMQMSAFGYGATGFSAAFRASYNIYSAEGWTDTAQGTFHSFFTTAKGTTTTSEKARLSDAGHLLIGTTTDDGTNLLQVAGGTSTQALTASGTVSGAGFTTLLASYARLASPAFTGAPTAPTVASTAAAGTTQLATTAFVRNGTTTNDSALAGQVGEYISSTVPGGSAISLTSGTVANVTSISLTAGDWDVWGNASFSGGTSTVTTLASAWASTVSAPGSPTSPNNGGYGTWAGSVTGGAGPCVSAGFQRISLAATTTVYLAAYALFSSGNEIAYGFIGARRVR